VEGAGDGFHQDGERGNAPEPARLPQREDALDPAVPLGIVSALHQLAPEDGKAQCPLRPVIGGFHPFLHDKCPQRAHLPKTHQLFSDRFAHPHEVHPLVSQHWHNETGLLLGVTPFNQTLSVRPGKKRRELGNVLVDALTRGGKGLLAISQLLTWPHSAVVLDIKGELHEATAEYRKTLEGV
jgi:Type IV secretory system Conjugative DNA transfer